MEDRLERLKQMTGLEPKLGGAEKNKK